MDKDRERFARMAERAKEAPFTPLDNLLIRGDAAKIAASDIDPDYMGCSCSGCRPRRKTTDERVTEKLARLRRRKGTVAEAVPAPVAPASDKVDAIRWTIRSNDALDAFYRSAMSYTGTIQAPSDSDQIVASLSEGWMETW